MFVQQGFLANDELEVLKWRQGVFLRTGNARGAVKFLKKGKKWAVQELNLQPPRCSRGALEMQSSENKGVAEAGHSACTTACTSLSDQRHDSALLAVAKALMDLDEEQRIALVKVLGFAKE